MLELVVAVATIARDEIERTVEMRLRGRALCPAMNGSARYTRAGHNKSLDASGVSGLLIHNLSVAQSSAAASTQPLCGTKAAVFRNAVSACGVTSY